MRAGDAGVDGARSRVTISVLARAAGVSVGTVSKALNGRGQLRPQTRTAVREAADRLGFRANSLARGLLSGRSYTVGLITSDSFGRFSLPVMLGAEDALAANQMSVFLCDTRDDPVREQHYVATLTARQVDGFIVTSRLSRSRPPLELTARRPVVYVRTRSTDTGDVSVVSDDVAGGRLAVEYLLAIGRRHVAHVTGPQRHRSATDRVLGATAALADAGTALVAGRPLYGEWSEEWGRQAVGVALAADPDLDAVSCGSDQVARGVIDGLREAGRSVPADVAVVGYDDWDVMATGRIPMLTTVDPELSTIGRRAGQLLLAALDGMPEPGVHVTTPRLVVRQSTASAGHRR